MQLCFIHAGEPGAVDATLSRVVATLQDQGRRPVGVIQEPARAGPCHRCDMDLIDIATGTRIPLSQDLGRGSTGCRLDPDAIEAAAMRASQALRTAPADLLVVNRFGKLEATGHGFRPVIAEALARGISVLVGVNHRNRPAFDAFAGGLARELSDTPAAVLAWLAVLPEPAET